MTRKARMGIFLLLLLEGACSRHPVTGPETSLDEPPVTIGVLLPLSGDLAEGGRQDLQAAQLAAGHVNQGGGILRHRLELRIVDTGTDVDLGVQGARTLVDSAQVQAIVGAEASKVTLAVAQQVTIPAQVILISPSSTSGVISELNAQGYLWRTAPSDYLQGDLIARYLLQKGFRKAGVIHTEDVYGRGLRDAFGLRFELQGTVVGTIPLPPDPASFRPFVQEMSLVQPDAVLLAVYPPQGAGLLKAAHQGGFQWAWVGTDGIHTSDFIELAGTDLTEGLIGIAPYYEPSSPFAEWYRQVYREAPQGFTFNTYDALMLLALAMEQAGTIDAPALRNALPVVADPPGEMIEVGADEYARACELLSKGEDINYVGASGYVDFRPQGCDLSNVFYEIWRVHKGQFVHTAVIY